MKTLNYLYCCFYFYAKETLSMIPLLLATLTGLFVIHKLVGWSIWVMSL